MKILMLTAAPTGPRSPFPQGMAERAHIYGVWLTLANRGHMKPPSYFPCPKRLYCFFLPCRCQPGWPGCRGFLVRVYLPCRQHGAETGNGTGERRSMSANGNETIFTMEATPLKYGPGATEEVGWEINRLGVNRVMVVSDPGVV